MPAFIVARRRSEELFVQRTSSPYGTAAKDCEQVPCHGCESLTSNRITVDGANVPCCGDPWCTKVAHGGRLDQD